MTLGLEDKLRRQLQNAGVVGGGRGQECRGRAICRAITCRIINRAPLRMVEDIEGFRAKLEVHLFAHGEVLEEAHIEISAVRQTENVAAGVAIGKPLRSGKGIAVVEARALYSGGMPQSDIAVDWPHDVCIGLDGAEPLLLTVFPVPALSALCVFITLKGVPDWKLVRSDICHPPSTECKRPGWVKNGRS